MHTPATDRPWDHIRYLAAAGDRAALAGYLDEIGPAETARALSRLDTDDHARVLALLHPADAADVIEEVPGGQAVELIGELPPQQAAAIVDAMRSDRQADVLAGLHRAEAEAILREMPPEAAQDVRHLLTYPADTAGGLMVTEYLAYRDDLRVRDVVDDLHANRQRYADYTVQYAYVIDRDGRLVGVLRMRDLVFTDRAATLADVMIRTPLSVRVDARLDELIRFFHQQHLLGVPVVDAADRLCGVVQRAAMEHAEVRRSDRQFLGIAGIVGGDEFRSMPLRVRANRRLLFLTINAVLNVVAASVIAFYQDTLEAVIALAVFLPIISDMCGCAGNQAVAVSVRELTLGLVRPREVWRVLSKEAALGLLNGLALGLLLGFLAALWQGNPYLGLVVGGALAINTLVAVAVGGLLPLLAHARKMDPALVSSPILTSVTDMCGFFLALRFATLLLPKLTGA